MIKLLTTELYHVDFVIALAIIFCIYYKKNYGGDKEENITWISDFFGFRKYESWYG